MRYLQHSCLLVICIWLPCATLQSIRTCRQFSLREQLHTQKCDCRHLKSGRLRSRGNRRYNPSAVICVRTHQTNGGHFIASDEWVPEEREMSRPYNPRRAEMTVVAGNDVARLQLGKPMIGTVTHGWQFGQVLSPDPGSVAHQCHLMSLTEPSQRVGHKRLRGHPEQVCCGSGKAQHHAKQQHQEHRCDHGVPCLQECGTSRLTAALRHIVKEGSIAFRTIATRTH